MRFSTKFLVALLAGQAVTATTNMGRRPEFIVRVRDISVRPSGHLIERNNFPWQACSTCVAQCVVFTAVCVALCFGGIWVPFAGEAACTACLTAWAASQQCFQCIKSECDENPGKRTSQSTTGTSSGPQSSDEGSSDGNVKRQLQINPDLACNSPEVQNAAKKCTGAGGEPGICTNRPPPGSTQQFSAIISNNPTTGEGNGCTGAAPDCDIGVGDFSNPKGCLTPLGMSRFVSTS